MQTNIPPAATPGARQTIVLADDGPALTTLGGELRAAKFDVVEVHDSESALDACLTKNPSLAIINYSVSGSAGVQLGRSIAERTPIPMIFVASDAYEQTVREAIDAGAVNYILKPINTQQFLAAVRTALQRAVEHQALRDQASQLTTALQTGRNIAVATGILMAQFRISQNEALERLRRQARSRRVRLEEVAAEVLSAAEQIGQVYGSLSR